MKKFCSLVTCIFLAISLTSTSISAGDITKHIKKQQQTNIFTSLPFEMINIIWLYISPSNIELNLVDNFFYNHVLVLTRFISMKDPKILDLVYDVSLEEVLLKHKNLKGLKLDNAILPKNIDQVLSNFTRLQEIDLGKNIGLGKSINWNQLLLFLGRLDILKKIDLSKCYGEEPRYKNISFSSLCACTSLQELNLRSIDDISDANLLEIGKLNNLTYLNLGYAMDIRTTNVGLEELSRLTNLKKLNLAAFQYKEEFLIHLSRLHKLEELVLTEAPIQNENLKYLIYLTNLKTLELIDCYINDVGLEFLAQIISLELIDLEGLQYITKEGLRHLSRLTKLQKIRINPEY